MSYINKFGEGFNKYNHKNKNIVIEKHITQIHDDLADQINNLNIEVEHVYLKPGNDKKNYKKIKLK